MVKLSLVIMGLLTLLIAMVLRWRQQRAPAVAIASRKRRAPGLLARGKAGLDRWVTAAAIAAVLTIALMGGLHWIRVWLGHV